MSCSLGCTDELRLEAAEHVLQTIDEEAHRNFVTLRESALVNVCASFEHLLKAFFVHGALEDEAAAAARIASLRIRLNASDALAVPRSELWFSVADQVFETLGQGTTMAARTQRFLLDCTHLPAGILDRGDLEKLFGQLDAKTFNEAFMVRNCVVHKGGRHSAVLARSLNKAPGSQIAFSGGYVTRLIKPIKDIADQLSPLWLVRG